MTGRRSCAQRRGGGLPRAARSSRLDKSRGAERKSSSFQLLVALIMPCEMWRCIAVVRASRYAPQALLSMRYFFDRIKKIPHPEKAAMRRSRGTHCAHPTGRQFPPVTSMVIPLTKPASPPPSKHTTLPCPPAPPPPPHAIPH